MGNRSGLVATGAVFAVVMLANAKAQEGRIAPADAWRPPAPMANFPEGMLPLAVLTTRAEADMGEMLPVCLYHRARPRPLEVVTKTCRNGADHCTAMVAVPRDAPFAFIEYDAANPAVSTTMDGDCDRPHARPTAGVLPRRADR